MAVVAVLHGAATTVGHSVQPKYRVGLGSFCSGCERERLTNSIGSPLSPGQTCYHQVPKHLFHAAVANLVRSSNCHYASRGVGRIALRDCPVSLA
ncbi:hypothetical protein PIB30_084506 [Stylosanthes scabra]|uniref:Secreted protein n=1 Tax=Stylosanthes scabra TaxID=79078 RepID=A0ABU6UW98_9FABA|nr:hypothetical protein [Stylosanthes scabra]